MFIMHALDNILVREAQILVKLLESTEWDTASVNVLYLKNSYVDPPRGRKKRKIEARLFHIVDATSNGKSESKELENYGQINIGSTINLAKIFEDVAAKFPSQRVMLFTWDHGSGFGVFEADPESSSISGELSITEIETLIRNTEGVRKPRFLITNNKIAQLKQSSTGDLTASPTHEPNAIRLYPEVNTYLQDSEVRESTDILTNEELSRAIISGFKGQKVDILVMVNCFMQMVETGYSLKNCVDYLVACETGFWAYGFDYQSIFLQLNQDPDTDTKFIGKLFVDTIENTYRRINELKLLNSVVVSTCNLKYADLVSDYINEFVRLVNSNIQRYYPLIKKARKKVPEISSLIFKRKSDIFAPFPIFIVDIMYLLFLLSNENDEIKRVFQTISNDAVYNKYIVARRIGSDFETDNMNVEEINGFSIYFPQFKKDAIGKEYYRYFYKHNAKFEIEFSKKTLWSQFLSVYLNLGELQ